MSFTTVPNHNPGETFPSADWNNYVAGNLNSGVMRKIADSTLGAPAASIDFASIPATFAQLVLVLQARGDAAATSIGLSLRLNNDTGANYDSEFIQAAAAGVTAGETIAGTAIQLGAIPAATAPASVFGQARIEIANYAAATAQKTLTAQTAAKTVNGTGGVFSQAWTGFWRSALAINELTLLLASGNFVAGTRATLYGLPQ